MVIHVSAITPKTMFESQLNFLILLIGPSDLTTYSMKCIKRKSHELFIEKNVL